MKITCSNCGKRVPFSGKVCPWCHASKSDEKLAVVLALACALVAVIVANGILDLGILYAFVSGVVGAGIGSAIGGVINAKRHKRPQIPDLGI